MLYQLSYLSEESTIWRIALPETERSVSEANNNPRFVLSRIIKTEGKSKGRYFPKISGLSQRETVLKSPCK